MRSKGFAIEQTTEAFLIKKGLTPFEKNFSGKQGEIDLIMRDGNCITFIEVRFRKNPHYGSPAESIQRNKLKKIVATAKYFLSIHELWDQECRFDVVAVTQSKNKNLEFDWIQNAFNEQLSY